MKSLRQQILLLVFSLVLGTIVLSSTVAFLRFEHALERVAMQQTATIATRLSTLLEQEVDHSLREADTLRSMLAGDTTVRIEAAAPGSPGIGPLQRSNAAVFYDITIPIDPDSTHGEQLVLRRSVAAGQMARLVPELTGGEGVVLLGSPAGVPAPARALALNVAAAGLVILLLATVAAVLATRQLSRPLNRLNTAIAEVAEGEYRQRVPVSGPVEVADLARTFNLMADRIEEGRDRLEHQVEQRTRELEAAVTELRRKQEQLVRNERLETIGRLASSVGHELRSPLSVMTHAVYFLEMISHDVPTAVRDYHGILRYQILLAEKVVADLIDFARIEPPRKHRVELRRLVEDQIEKLGTLNGVSLVRNFDPSPPFAFIDAAQVGQALLNILTNATQALDGAGTITVRTFSSGQTVGVSVEDTGPGIDSQFHARIFEPLYTTKSRGIGLGLSVARGLVDANNGHIEIESEPGSGTVFTIHVPGA